MVYNKDSLWEVYEKVMTRKKTEENYSMCGLMLTAEEVN